MVAGFLTCHGTVGAQEEGGTAEPEPLANYAFSTQLGSGVYSSSGGTVKVFRIAGGFTLHSGETDEWGLELRIPLTLGFYNLELGSVLATGLPESLATLALVPEVRADVAVARRWHLMPFAAAGVGRDFSEGQVNYILALGTRSMVAFDEGRVDVYLGNRLLYAGYTTPEFGFGDDFAALESGADARHPMGFSVGEHRVDAGLFLMNYLYLASPELVRFYGKPLSVNVQWELGVTFGTVTPLKVVGLTIPRVGVSYRVGSGVRTVRLVLGGPFS